MLHHERGGHDETFQGSVSHADARIHLVKLLDKSHDRRAFGRVWGCKEALREEGNNLLPVSSLLPIFVELTNKEPRNIELLDQLPKRRRNFRTFRETFVTGYWISDLGGVLLAQYRNVLCPSRNEDVHHDTDTNLKVRSAGANVVATHVFPSRLNTTRVRITKVIGGSFCVITVLLRPCLIKP